MEDPGTFIEDIVAILPGEVIVASPKVESDLLAGESGETLDIYNANGKGDGFWDGKHALSFIMMGT